MLISFSALLGGILVDFLLFLRLLVLALLHRIQRRVALALLLELERLPARRRAPVQVTAHINAHLASAQLLILRV